MSLIKNAIQRYRSDGLFALLRAGFRHTAGEAMSRTRGYRKLSADGTVVKFVLNTSDGPSTLSRYESEVNEIKDILAELRDTDVVYDIGANTGLYTCFIGKRIHSGKVVAFEPYPPNINQLETNADLNDVNVRIWPVAVSDADGLTNFEWPDVDAAGYGEASITDEETGHEVRTISIDERVADGELPVPNVVKIDVEGSEPLVIEGMKSCLQHDDCRLVYCEVHLPTDGNRASIKDFGVTQEELVKTVCNSGFKVEFKKESGNRVFYKFRKSD